MYAYICILITVLYIFYLDKRFVLCASFFFHPICLFFNPDLLQI